MPIVAEYAKYTLPSFLSGVLTPAAYSKWLTNRSRILLWRDQKNRKPYAASSTKAEYRSLIHDALAWHLMGVFDNVSAHEKGDAYKRKFYLLPTVDHTDPEVLGLEICSWLVNECKNFLNAEEFIAFCGRVAGYCSKNCP
jgi:hypothetical protein